MSPPRRRPPFDRARWEVMRERFHIADETPPASHPLADHISAAIGPAIKSLQLQNHGKTMDIASVWNTIASGILVGNSRPGNIQDKILTIYVRHPGHLMEARGKLEADILQRIQAQFGANTIQALRWSIDPTPPKK